MRFTITAGECIGGTVGTRNGGSVNMSSQGYEILTSLGGEMGTYTPQSGAAKRILAFVAPIRRTDQLGNQAFLSKTYELWFVKSDSEGVKEVSVNYDTFAIKLEPSDTTETTLRITKVYPERDAGIPGDGVGMWHCEAVL